MKKEMQLMVLSLGMMVETALCVASGMDLKITKLSFELLSAWLTILKIKDYQ